MSTDKLAFMIGLMGSLHCIGMCGPLAFAIPSQRQGWFYLMLDKLSYQFGRIISYCFLGVLVGLIGQQIWLSGLQQLMSILSGILILLAAWSRIFRLSWFRNSPSFLLKPFNQMYSYALKHKANHLIVGIVNGFLPCGFVYLALAGALNTRNILNAVSYMFWFGAGTVPLMLIATFSMGFANHLLRKSINKSLPYIMLFLGIWFILRGLELNIPYLSPPPQTEAAICK